MKQGKIILKKFWLGLLLGRNFNSIWAVVRNFLKGIIALSIAMIVALYFTIQALIIWFIDLYITWKIAIIGILVIVFASIIYAVIQHRKSLIGSHEESLRNLTQFRNFSAKKWLAQEIRENIDLWEILKERFDDETGTPRASRYVLEWRYTSPNGKNHYSNKKVFKTKELDEIFDSINDEIGCNTDSNGVRVPVRMTSYSYIYAYDIPGLDTHENLIKVGFTSQEDPLKRIEQQFKNAARIKYRLRLLALAMRDDGSEFRDHEVHRVLKNMGIRNPEGEWFECSPATVERALLQIKSDVQ